MFASNNGLAQCTHNDSKIGWAQRDATERHQLIQHNRFKHMFNAARNGVGACSRWLLQTRLARFGLARLEFEFSEQGALAMRQTCPPETAVLINHTAANTRQARRAL